MDAAVSASANRVTRALEEGLRAIVTPKFVRQASVADAVAGVLPQIVAEPATEQELAKVLKLADEAGLAVIPRGGGTKVDWGNPPGRADLILSTLRLNRILEHAWADLTVTVEAGCTIGKLQGTLAKHGQRLALDALWPEHATVGGMLSTNDSGALRLRFGSLRDLIIGVTLALPDGTLASSGGKVVKNVAGYDLPKLATGALGTLGVITRAVCACRSGFQARAFRLADSLRWKGSAASRRSVRSDSGGSGGADRAIEIHSEEHNFPRFEFGGLERTAGTLFRRESGWSKFRNRKILDSARATRKHDRGAYEPLR